MAELTETSQPTTTGANDAQPSHSLNRQIVLEEDEYTEALSHIIARDFFPSLVHLDATNNYLDALRSEDPHLINASVRQLQRLTTPLTSSQARGRPQPFETPLHTPWGAGPFDTPQRPVGMDGAPPAKRARYDIDTNLDEFQARYTSEDNASFIQILDGENHRRSEKFGWAWDAQQKVEAQRDKMLEGRKQMLIEAAPAPGVLGKQRIEAPMPVGLIEGRNDRDEDNDEDSKEAVEQQKGELVSLESEEKEVTLISSPTGYGDSEKPKVDVMARQKDTRSAGVDGWKFKARNALMFSPDVDVPSYASSFSSTPSQDSKIIKYGNTRLPEQNDNISSSTSEPPSPTRSRVDAAIAGAPYRPHSPTDKGFSLLPSVPSPTPSQLGPAAVKQLMTWGTLNATPRIISHQDDPADTNASDRPSPTTPFHIPAPTSREALGHKLSSNASKSLRVKAKMMNGGLKGLGIYTPPSARSHGNGTMPPPNFTPRKAEAAGSLTPAARRLLDRTTTGTAGARRAGANKVNERDLNKVRWTPSPAPAPRKR